MTTNNRVTIYLNESLSFDNRLEARISQNKLKLTIADLINGNQYAVETKTKPESTKNPISRQVFVASAITQNIDFELPKSEYSIGQIYYLAIRDITSDEEVFQTSFEIKTNLTDGGDGIILQFLSSDYTLSGQPISETNKIVDQETFENRETALLANNNLADVESIEASQDNLQVLSKNKSITVANNSAKQEILLNFEVLESDIIEGDQQAMIYELENGRLLRQLYNSGAISYSDNGGVDWTEILPFQHANAQPRVNFIDSNNNIYFSKGLAGQSGRLWRSTDGGNTVQLVLDTAVASPSQYSNALWFMAEDSAGNLYIQEYSFGGEATQGWKAVNVYRSQDQGDTWSVWYVHPDTNLRHLHLVAIDSEDQIYVSGAHNISSATSLPDVAGTWFVDSLGNQEEVITPRGICGGMTGFAEADNGSLFFGSDRLNGIFRLDKVNKTFINVFNYDDPDIEQPDQILDIKKGRHGLLYAVGNVLGNIYISADNGRNWAVTKFPVGFNPSRPTICSVGRGPTPRVYFERSSLDTWYALPDYTKEEFYDRVSYANKPRVYSIEGLSGNVLLEGVYVKATGDETIAGVKNFSSSPIVSATNPTLTLSQTGDGTSYRLHSFTGSFRITKDPGATNILLADVNNFNIYTRLNLSIGTETTGMQINKNTTGSSTVLDINNAGTGKGVEIDQNGNGIALNIDSEATTQSAIFVDHAASDQTWSIQSFILGTRSFCTRRVDNVNQSKCFIFGSYYFWVDATGKLRIKNGVPTTDLDGTVVGTQT